MAGSRKPQVPFFPMMVNVHGRTCLVVGAGKVAAGKIESLLSYGAKIVVVSPRAVSAIRAKAHAGKLTWHCRRFSEKDLLGVFLVIAATNSTTVNGAVFRACRTEGVLCNSVDDPEHCDFFYPAVVRRGALQIAISTNGNLPALAARLRKQLDAQFGPEWGDYLDHAGKLRHQVRARKLPMKTRRDLSLQLASPTAFEEFKSSRRKVRAVKK